MKKRLLSVLMVLCMVLTLLPVSTFAAPATENNVESAINAGTFYQAEWSNDFGLDGSYYPYWTNGSVTLADGSAQDRGTPKLWPNHSNFTTPNANSYYNIVVQGENGVVDVDVTQDGAELIVSFAPVSPGETTVQISLSFKYTTTGMYGGITSYGNLYLQYDVKNTVGGTGGGDEGGGDTPDTPPSELDKEHELYVPVGYNGDMDFYVAVNNTQVSLRNLNVFSADEDTASVTGEISDTTALATITGKEVGDTTVYVTYEYKNGQTWYSLAEGITVHVYEPYTLTVEQGETEDFIHTLTLDNRPLNEERIEIESPPTVIDGSDNIQVSQYNGETGWVTTAQEADTGSFDTGAVAFTVTGNNVGSGIVQSTFAFSELVVEGNVNWDAMHKFVDVVNVTVTEPTTPPAEDPTIDSFTKERVTTPPVDGKIDGVIMNPFDETVDYGATVTIPADGSVTLMYKLTVTGDAGAFFKIADENVKLVGSNYDASRNNSTGIITGSIPEGGTAVMYVIKTFTASDINSDGELVNTATIEAGTDSDLDDTLDEEDGKNDGKYETSDGGTEASEADPDPEPGEDLNGTDVTVQVYVDRAPVQDPLNYVNLSRVAKGGEHEKFVNKDNNDGTLTYDFDYENGGNDCVDIQVDVKNDDAYVLQGVTSYQSYGEDGTENVIANEGGTYTIDNVNGSGTNPDVIIYLRTKYAVEYYKVEGNTTSLDAADSGIYITAEDVTDEQVNSNPTLTSDMPGTMNWKNPALKTSINVKALPTVDDNKTVAGWWLNDPTCADETTYSKNTTVEVDTAVNSLTDGSKIIKFYAKITEKQTGHIIKASAGPNGSMKAGEYVITDGNDAQVPIADGGRVTFNITPAKGYAVKSITVDWETHGYPYTMTNDGTSPNPGGNITNTWTSYTMPDMGCDQSIHVEFGADTNGDGISDDLEQHILVFAMYDNDFAAAKAENKRVEEFLVKKGTNLYEYMAANFTPAAVAGYTADVQHWYNWDNNGSLLPENKTVDGWTNVIFNYVPKQYTLAYHGNGGLTGSGKDRSTSDVTYGREATLKNSSTFTREGYTFLGWATAPDGTASDLYVPSKEITVNNTNFPGLTDKATFDLYAVWEKDAPTLAELNALLDVKVGCCDISAHTDTYDLAEGYYTIGEQTVGADGSISCTVTVNPGAYASLYNNEYRAVQGIHNLVSKGEGSVLSVTLTVSDGKWVLAEGSEKNFFVNLTCKPGAPTYDQLTDETNGPLKGNAVVVMECTNNVEGHDKTYGLVDDSKAYTVSDVTLNSDGQWTCTVSIDAGYYTSVYNNETGAVYHSLQAAPEVEIPLVWNPVTRTWSCVDNTSVTWEITCEPAAVPVTITYHGNGGSFTNKWGTHTETNEKGVLDGPLTLYNTTYYFQREGYTNLGWSTTSDGAVQFQGAQQVTLNEQTFSGIEESKHIHLYAVWQKDAPTFEELEALNLNVTIDCASNVGHADGLVPLIKSTPGNDTCIVERSKDDPNTFNIRIGDPDDYIAVYNQNNPTYGPHTYYGFDGAKAFTVTWNGSAWEVTQDTVTILTKCEAPAALEDEDVPQILSAFPVDVDCINEDVSHQTGTYYLSYGTDGLTRFTVGDVIYDSVLGLYTCDVTILPDVYVDRYSDASYHGATEHTLSPADQTVTVKLVYQNGGWTKAEGEPDSATFTVMCEVSIPDAPAAGVLSDMDVRLRCKDDRDNHNCRFDVKAGTYKFTQENAFTYTVTIYPEAYLEDYNPRYPAVLHTLKNPEEMDTGKTVTLTWNADTQSWTVPSQVQFDVVCKPEMPQESDLNNAFQVIRVRCVDDRKGHNTAFKLKAGSYEIGEMTYDPDTGYSCELEITVDPYFNDFKGRYTTVEHKLVEGETETKTVTLTWNPETGAWERSSGLAEVAVTCKESQPPEAPSKEDLVALFKNRGAVQVDCTSGGTVESVHKNLTTALLAGTFEIGTPTRNEEGIWVLPITITGTDYIADYVEQWGAHTVSGSLTKTNTDVFWDDAQWTYDGDDLPLAVFDVRCTQPEKPQNAEVEVLLKKAVGIDCITSDGWETEHPNRDYDLIAGTYTVGSVELTADNQWVCQITVEPGEYVNSYNQEFSGHTLNIAGTTQTYTLVWGSDGWVVQGSIPKTFDVKCEAGEPEEPEPPVTYYSLTYHANGGNAEGIPTDENQYAQNASVDLKAGSDVALGSDGDDVVFVGWSTSSAYSKSTPAESEPETVTKIIFGTSNITVYAVWAIDTNNNDIADYQESEDPNPPQPGKDEYIIYAYAGRHGDIEPSGTVTVQAGENETFYFDPDNGYEVDCLVVDGKHLSARDSYTFYDVDENHTIYVYFTSADKEEDEEDEEDDDRDDTSDPTYAVYYYPGYGSGARDLDKRYEEDTEVEVLAFEDVDLTGREGYTFIGWSTQPNAGSVTYLPGDTFDMPDHDVYLYAQWLRDQIGPEDTGVANWLNTIDHIAYLTGYPNGAFGPNNSMTRAEVAQMFYALLNNKNVTITASFPDVPADAWYATAVNTLASLGMVSGDADGSFRPNDPITRAEFCVIALAFAYEPESYSCSFTDVSVNDWFYTYVAQAASYGWIGGYADGSFGPNDLITRAQVTTIVNNMLGREADRGYVNTHTDTLVQFYDLTRIHWAYYDIMEAVNEHEYTRTYGVEDWVE